MIRYLLTLALALIASPALAQTVTSATKLTDGNGDGQIVVNKAVTTPQVKKGTVLFDCGSKAAPFVYAVGKPENCPAQVKTATPLPIVDGKNKNGVYGVTTYPGPVRVGGAYRVIESYPTTVASNVKIDGLATDDLQRGGIRLRGQIAGVTISNSTFKFRAAPQVTPNLPACLEIGDKDAKTRITNVLVQNVICEGFQMTLAPDRYWNGDGPTVEANVAGVRFDHVISRNNTDGCFDVKPYFTATDIVAEGCKRNLRIWKGADIEHLTSITPIKRGGSGVAQHVWIHGNDKAPPVVHIGLLEVTSTNAAPIITIEDGGAIVTIGRCKLDVPAGTPFRVGGSKNIKLTVGDGCVPPRQVGVPSGVPVPM
ncbi:hypothetical protein [uncultured Novosphingobium sp.]|uniref:hypothetical protein n=1 Tax=uncultured Novosphingobium sp. TaxID=292277 RepID=UPI003749A077